MAMLKFKSLGHAVQSANAVLLEARRRYGDTINISYSGGKDALAVADLCSKVFSKLNFFFMYLVDGLEPCELQMEYAKNRWGANVFKVPHWIVHRFKTTGTYCDVSQAYLDVKRYTLADVYRSVQAEFKCVPIAAGHKKADGMARRIFLSRDKASDFMVYPLLDWGKYDVLQYLKQNKIPLPDASAGISTGMDLSNSTIYWLHDKYHSDYKRVIAQYPYARAIIERRAMFGDEINETKAGKQARWAFFKGIKPEQRNDIFKPKTGEP
jgi:hypothetical protein